MGQEAKIRVRLDLGGARSDLAGLYKEMGNAPGVAAGGVPGIGGGGAGAGVGAPGAAGFGGLGFGRLFGLGAGLLGAGALLRGAGADAGAIGGALTGGISETIRTALFGDLGAQARGGARAIDKVKEQLGLAIGLQAGTPEEAKRLAGRFQGVFDTYNRITTAEERGKQGIDSQFKPQVAEQTLGGIIGRLTEAVDRLIRFLDRFNG